MPSWCACEAPGCWASRHEGKASCSVQVRCSGLVCRECQEAAGHRATAAEMAEPETSKKGAPAHQEAASAIVEGPPGVRALADLFPRFRCVAKRPPPEEGPAIVHHFWLALDPATESADNTGAESAECFLVALGAPTCWRLALASVCPQPQMLWVLRRHMRNVTEAVRKAELPGAVTVMAVETLFPKNAGDSMRLSWLHQYNVPPQWVKDAVSMWAVSQHGGWALDLDVVALQPVTLWPRSPGGYCFCAYPRKTAGWFQGHEALSLAVFATPRGSEIAQLLGLKFWTAACHHARTVACGQRERCDWNGPAGAASWRLWCQNQRMLGELVRSMDHLTDAVQDSIAFIPYPSWLRAWPPEATAQSEVVRPPRKCAGDVCLPATKPAAAVATSAVAAAPAATLARRRIKMTSKSPKGPAAVATSSRAVVARSPRVRPSHKGSPKPGPGAASPNVSAKEAGALEKFGCVLFEPREVARKAFTVNLWWRQWPAAQREAVMKWAWQVCLDNQSSSSKACSQQLKSLCPHLDGHLFPGGAAMAYGLACTWLHKLTGAVDRCIPPPNARLLAASMLQTCASALCKDGWVEYRLRPSSVQAEAETADPSSVAKQKLAHRLVSLVGPAAAVDYHRMQACP